MTDLFTAPAGISQRTWDEAMALDSNPVGPNYHSTVDRSHRRWLSEIAASGGQISRLRILTDRWAGVLVGDISYFHATLGDGTVVEVNYDNLNWGGVLYGPKGLKSALIEWAKSEGVYAKGLGLLDESNWSVLK